MATPTFAQARDTWKDRVLLLDELDKFMNSNTDNWIGMENALIEGLEGDDANAIMDEVARSRASASGLLSQSAVRGALAGPLRGLMQAIGEPDRGFAANLIQLRQYLIDNSDSLNSRGLTYGSISAGGGNVGGGTVNRLTVDDQGEPLEGGHTEAVTIKCLRDQGQATKHEEEFVYIGANRVRDAAQVSGSGLYAPMKALSALDSGNFVSNPSFSIYNGTTPATSSPSTPTTTTDLPGWTMSATSSFAVDLDTVYRGFDGDTTPYSLEFVADGNIEQVFEDELNPSFLLDVPYYLQIAVYRQSLATGTLTVELGSQTQAFTIGSLTNNAWNICRLDLDKDIYYRNWRENSANLKLTVASLATSTIFVDDIILAPMTLVDGLYYAIVGDSTPFAVDDEFTFTNSESTRGILQYWTCFRSGINTELGYGFSLPSDNGGSETVTDP